MSQEPSFGNFVRQRRRELDLTQEELARRVGCAAITLRKIEADDLRASVQIAERLAMALAIPLAERAEFVRRARAVRPETADASLVTPPPSMDEIGREDLTGRAIRGYALSERIGMGGMGSVYRAVQPNVEREVAIKIILPAFANHPDFIRRFEAEAQLVARLEHPHIVPLYDYWREPGVAYLVMRLLRGGSIQSLLNAGAISAEITARMLEQVCTALNAAHRIGVIHRDLKPANVLLDEDSNAYLADFGIAKNLGNPDIESQTQVDAMLGSPQYMSPEQIRSLSVGPQTDIYCLGVMTYEMLTGALPFSGPTPFDLIQQHINTPMPPLSARQTGLPAALDAVIGRATAKDPAERYADALAFLNDFRMAMGRVGEARPMVITYEEEEPDLEILNPFKGLRAFGEADSDNFFGRESLIQQLLARLGEGGDLNRFLAVIGPSGSGKSSVVRAGLVPALRRGGLPGSENWFIVDLLPGKHPFEELETALLRVAVNPPESLLSQLKDGKRGLLRAAHRILPADPSVELVLVIDQFEEIFTLVEDEEERALLLESLATAVMDERSRLRVVITLRADFTDKPLRYVDFGEMLNRRFEFVLPLNADEIERAVAGPTQQALLKLEKGLVSTIIRETGSQPGALPLLQFALSELFEKREGRTLTNSAYREIGGVLGALGRSAEILYASLGHEEQTAVRQIFLRLITLGEGTEDTRRRVLRAEIEALGAARLPGIHTVLDLFGKARLLTFDRDPLTRGATIEVAHEALLREWKRLREWLNESRTDVRMQRQLAHAAFEWYSANNEPSFLLSGARLEQFKGWITSTSIALTANEQNFLNASIQESQFRAQEEQERQQRELENAQKLAATEKQRADDQAKAARQLRKRAIGLAGALAVALAMAVAAIFFGGQAQLASKIATSRELAAAAVGNLEIDPERSILLAMEAVNAAQTLEAENALHQAIQASRIQTTIRAHEPGAPMTASFSPDGSRIISASLDNNVHVWDVASGQKLLTVSGYAATFSPDGKHLASVMADGQVKLWDAITGVEIPVSNRVDASLTVAFSPDGQRLVTVTSGSLPRVWDARTGRELVSFPGHSDYVSFAFFSPDGEGVLSVSDDGTARLWDSTSGAELMKLTGHPGWVQNAAFSPDGKRIATVSGSQAFLWDVGSGEKMLTLSGHQNPIFAVTFSLDGTHLATGSQDRTIHIWDVSEGRQLFTLAGHSGAIYDLSFSPDGTHLASASDDGTLRIWNLMPGREAFSLFTPHGASGQIALSPDGTLLAASDESGIVKTWAIRTGKEIVALPGPASSIKDLAFSRNGEQLIISSGDSMLKVWDVASGSLSTIETGHTGPITSLAASHDGKTVATTSQDYKVKLWDTTSLFGKNTRALLSLDHPAVVFAVAFNPTGDKLATGASDGSLRIWNIADGTKVQTFSGQVGEILDVAYSPDGKRLAAASSDGSVKIWEMTTGKSILTLNGHTNAVIALAFSPDGTRIATASRDGNARLWDAATGAELLAFPGDGGGLNDIVFSPDGSGLAIGADDSIRYILLDVKNLMEAAQKRVTRSLTQAECQKYLHFISEKCTPENLFTTSTPLPPASHGRICQVANVGSLYDSSFNELTHRGVQQVAQKMDWNVVALESSSIPKVERNIQDLLGSDCNMIVTLGFTAGDAVHTAAISHPEQKFLLLDFAYDRSFENIWSQVYATDQAAFLAGYLAAATTRTGKVGVFGGIDIPPVTDFMDGFALGVAYHNKVKGTQVETLGWDVQNHKGVFVGGFCCSTEGRAAAEALINQGADIILPVAGTSVGRGAAAAIRERDDVYLIGVDNDWTLTFPEYAAIILTSVEKRFDVSVVKVANAISSGAFSGNLHIGTLETGEVGLASFHNLDVLVPAHVKSDLEQIKTAIIAGEIQTRP